MPFVTFTVRRGLSAGDKSRLSEAMLEAQVAAGYHRADRFHRFLEVDQDDLLVNPRFPDYVTDRTDRFMVVEVVISSGRPTGTAATIADEAVRLFGERLHLAPQDVLFVFRGGTEPPALSCCADQARGDRGCLSRRSRDQCSHALELTLKGFLRSKGVASWRRMCSRSWGRCVFPAQQLKREQSLASCFSRADAIRHGISNTWFACGFPSSSLTYVANRPVRL